MYVDIQYTCLLAYSHLLPPSFTSVHDQVRCAVKGSMRQTPPRRKAMNGNSFGESNPASCGIEQPRRVASGGQKQRKGKVESRQAAAYEADGVQEDGGSVAAVALGIWALAHEQGDGGREDPKQDRDGVEDRQQ